MNGDTQLNKGAIIIIVVILKKMKMTDKAYMKPK
jgi:hypothetical protein